MFLDGDKHSYSTSSSSSSSGEANCLFPCLDNKDPKKKKKKKNKKRFSDKQIKSMESIFESKSKLEPCKKLKLAAEIGLEPRQVAIWFQNKRARWKTKQLERDYDILQSSYTDLASKVQQLNQENQFLTTQVQVLRGGVEKQEVGKEEMGRVNGAGPELLMGNSGIAVSDEQSSIKAEYEESNNHELMNIAEHGNWGGLETNDEGLLVDQSSSSYQWWNFWS